MKVFSESKRLQDVQGRDRHFRTIGQFDERIMRRLMGLASAQVHVSL